MKKNFSQSTEWGMFEFYQMKKQKKKKPQTSLQTHSFSAVQCNLKQTFLQVLETQPV